MHRTPIESWETGGELRFGFLGVYLFRDKSLNSAAVKPGNLRIAFDLPDKE